jgi:hypothetical protein
LDDPALNLGNPSTTEQVTPEVFVETPAEAINLEEEFVELSSADISEKEIQKSNENLAGSALASSDLEKNIAETA